MKPDDRQPETNEASSVSIVIGWLVLIGGSVLLTIAIGAGKIWFGGRGRHVEFSRSTEPEKFWGVVAMYVLVIFVGACILLALRAKDPPPKPVDRTPRDWLGHPIDQSKK